jgi:hypothetical protein
MNDYGTRNPFFPKVYAFLTIKIRNNLEIEITIKIKYLLAKKSVSTINLSNNFPQNYFVVYVNKFLPCEFTFHGGIFI